MAEPRTYNMKLTHPLNRAWKHPAGYVEGCVLTPNGIVAVYSQGSEKDVPSTNLDFVWEGRLYSRTIKRRYTQRGLVTVANRFADEIRGGQAWLD
jgi:hypothetical protein